MASRRTASVSTSVGAADGLRSAIRVRSSVCCRRSGGGWLIAHEHVSLPIAPGTLTAWFPPET